jgi:hypothetical protein
MPDARAAAQVRNTAFFSPIRCGIRCWKSTARIGEKNAVFRRISDVSSTSWRHARSFEELCDLGARFVEGRERFFPGWGAPRLDAESRTLVPVLAQLNRGGFLTLASQPGTLAGVDGCEQRAFVSGFCRPRHARALQRLNARCFVRGARGRAGVAVSRKHGRARVLAGHNAFESELELFREALAARAFEELARCVYWSAWDPVWGREGALWRKLEAVWS